MTFIEYLQNNSWNYKSQNASNFKICDSQYNSQIIYK